MRPGGGGGWGDTVGKHGPKARNLAWLVVLCATGLALIAIYSLILPSHVGRLTAPPALHAPLAPP